VAHQPEGSGLHPGRRRYSFDEVGELRAGSPTACSPRSPKETKGRSGDERRDGVDCTLGLCARTCAGSVGARNPATRTIRLDAFDCEILFFQKYFASSSRAAAELPGRLWICIDDELPDFPGARSLASWVADQPATPPNVAVDMDDVVMLSATAHHRQPKA